MIILASQSPRRVELLGLLGWGFVVKPSQVDESIRPGESAASYVCRLAESKARAVLPGAPQDALVVAADTAVVDQDEILGKPADTEDALKMLRQLRGRAHQVYSAIAVLRASDGRLLTDLCTTEVPMRAYSEAEMQAYVRSGDPMDKAGAYAIQSPSFRPVESLAGCFANVMGLPLCHLTRTLKRLGVYPPADVPARCQAAIGFHCRVFDRILSKEISV